MLLFIVLGATLTLNLALGCMNRVTGVRCVTCLHSLASIFAISFLFANMMDASCCVCLVQPHDEAAIPIFPVSLVFQLAKFSTLSPYSVGLPKLCFFVFTYRTLEK